MFKSPRPEKFPQVQRCKKKAKKAKIPTRQSQGLRTVNRATTVFETVARRFLRYLNKVAL